MINSKGAAKTTCILLDASLIFHTWRRVCRVFNQPHDGMLMEILQQLVDGQVKRDNEASTLMNCVAMLQLYSDKTLVTFKGKQCHPIRGTLLNIGYASRIRNIR